MRGERLRFPRISVPLSSNDFQEIVVLTCKSRAKLILKGGNGWSEGNEDEGYLPILLYYIVYKNTDKRERKNEISKITGMSITVAQIKIMD